MPKQEWFIALGLALILSSTAIPDEPQGRQTGKDAPQPVAKSSRWKEGTTSVRDRVENNGIAELASVSAIQEKLQLSKEQIAEIAKSRVEMTKHAQENLIESMKSRRENRRSVSREELLQASRDEHHKASEDHSKDLLRILGRPTWDRLMGFAIQLVGPISLGWPELQQRLQVNEFQKPQIDELLADYQREKGRLAQRFADIYSERRQSQSHLDDKRFHELYDADFDKIDADIAKLRKAAAAQLGKILTPQQRKTYNTLQGEVIDLEKLLQPGSGRY